MNYQELKNRLFRLHIYVKNHREAELRFVDDTGNSLLASFNTAYETDNDFDPDEGGYEDYEALAFCEKTTKKLFEITYRNLPEEIWDGDVRVI